ncbi:unnamed protein product [Fusarium graminearum]|nr:hypothetical protein HG531_007126 [Fusarium graminearum]PCD39341.1 hypothetical protein FGRA07_00612 [Fusarium graminearum]CAF3615949.1 unnamed protein product [Fusarium graminearum]CAG1965533.1 unnamed protein product [Fusarium graminearum]CAG1989442.1 unnamed protein product [Fusarium graminearum]
MSTEAQSPQEVSGQSAFWILASLAAAAVVLPSTSSRMSGRDLFGGNIDLVRCIPGVSLLDSICDTILLCLSTYRVLRAPKPVQRARRALPKVSVVAAKLMLSIFTVFPQIIKAISLKGVPATQFCAFVFFYAATTRLLIDLCGLEPEEPFTPPDEGDNSLDIIVLLVLPFQAPFQLWIWHRIVLSVKFQLSDTFYRICTWSSLVCSLLLIIQLIIWMLYVVSRWRFDITASPHVIPVRAFWLFITALAAARKPRKHEDRQSKSQAKIPPPPAASDKLVQAAGSMICAILLSILVAKALNLMGRLFALPIETPETSEALTEEGERPTDDSQQGADAEKDEEEPPVKPEGGQLGRLGGIVDRWLVRFLLMDTTADISITLTVFNLITTIIYYLVYFDGTGTVNPGWTSVLG